MRNFLAQSAAVTMLPALRNFSQFGQRKFGIGDHAKFGGIIASNFGKVRVNVESIESAESQTCTPDTTNSC